MARKDEYRRPEFPLTSKSPFPGRLKDLADVHKLVGLCLLFYSFSMFSDVAVEY